MEKTIRIYFLTLFLLATMGSYSQNQNNTWYFGNEAGLDFNSGAPIALTDGMMYTQEGCSTISDASGNLLFYTNGVNVWNRDHMIMPNGTGLGGHTSTTQSALIVPMPGDTNKYYLFAIMQLGGAMTYSVVDMTLDSGLGDVVALSKNTLLHDAVSEKQIAIQRCDGNVWLISHEWGSSNFFSQLITPSGIDSGIITNVGSSHSGSTLCSIGSMKASQQGDRIALGTGYCKEFEIFDFDINTGILSSPISISSTSYSICSGVEFSPNGKFLYASSAGTHEVFQFDLTAGSADAVAASSQVVRTGFDYICAMQLGVDGKIYIARITSSDSGPNYLDVINDPDSLGVACNYVSDGISLGVKNCLAGLPNFMIRASLNLSVLGKKNICLGDSTVLTATGTSGYHWTGGIDTTERTITVHPSSTTAYYVTSDSGFCGIITDTILVIVKAISGINVSEDTMICYGSSVTLTATGGSAYQWSGGSVATSNEITVHPLSTTVYYVRGDSANCEYDTDTVNVTVNNGLPITVSKDTAICPGESIALTASGSVGYKWSGGSTDTTNTIVVHPSAITSYYVTGDSSICGYDTDTVTVSVKLLSDIQVSGDTAICAGQSTTLIANGGFSYQWSGGSDATSNEITVSPSSATTYYITGDTTSCGADTDTISVQVNDIPAITVSGNEVICSGQSTMLTANGGSFYQWSGGSNATTGTIVVSPSVTTTYYVTGDSTSCGYDTDTLTVEVNATVSTAFFNYTVDACSSEVKFQYLSENATVYSWDFGDGNTSNEENPSHPFQQGSYLVSLLVNGNTVCADSSEQTVVITNSPVEALTIPNIFTPNGDGVNDEFKISGITNCKEYHLEIYNRWGQKVFETTTPSTVFWDGKNGSKNEIAEGVYYYTLTIKEGIYESTGVSGFVSVLK